MVYVKSVAVGLLAAIAAIVIQAVVFVQFHSSSDDGGGMVGGFTQISDAPVVIAFAAGSLIALWRLRAKTFARK